MADVRKEKRTKTIELHGWLVSWVKYPKTGVGALKVQDPDGTKYFSTHAVERKLGLRAERAPRAPAPSRREDKKAAKAEAKAAKEEEKPKEDATPKEEVSCFCSYACTTWWGRIH